MKVILIADAGSSKTDWSLISEQKVVNRYESVGINPAHSDPEDIVSSFLQVKEAISSRKIDEVYFYGAGCATRELKDKVSDSLGKTFDPGEIYVESDLTAAGIALFGKETGCACILGTGSSTGIYADGKITRKIPSLGFLLGDEGSGTALGKRLLNAIYKERLPKTFKGALEKEYQINLASLINKVYSLSKPGPYLASFSPFLLKNIENPEIKELVKEEFNSFIEKNLLPYDDINSFPIGMVGSIASYYSEIIKECAHGYGLGIKEVIQKPMPFLEKFYCEK